MNLQRPTPDKSHIYDGTIELHSIFLTMQGEGPHAGRPAIFVRLAHCNLACPACDTEYTQGAKKVKPQYIVDKVKELKCSTNLVVITGGEPFRQHLGELVELLVSQDFHIQFETNGTLPPTFDTWYVGNGNVDIICSPKSRKLDKGLAEHVTAFKYVVSYLHIDVEDGLPSRVLDLKAGKIARPPSYYTGPIYVQPMDSKDEEVNNLHLDAAIRSCMLHGYTLCLQVHKIINME
ncbi:MAG: putative 7-carboxy-7-deazaguanine synthase [Prokaryotic dsDNA virus sp.]|nr:MAG: putative 7-carboxy-7-deazaguanine synthase [Prokaryotic dsDNA virus sp.]|tara:strand:+ start:25751 stop:26452 length:702 start_codon:yes stop_codon:yes gene_type:complete